MYKKVFRNSWCKCAQFSILVYKQIQKNLEAEVSSWSEAS